jgi:peptidoglycan biosynthesis protein MviN/MurJ (putative lipid II flippase)
MSGASSTFIVALLAIAAAGAALVLVGWLRRRPGRSPRRRVMAFFIGLAAVELLCAPALVLAWRGDALLGWRAGAADVWIAGAAYGALSLLVIARLFPWREVTALASAPGATVRDVLGALAQDEDDREGRPDQP